MRLLLDTHSFIWLSTEPKKLSQKAYDYLADSSNTIILSVISTWEMQIKIQIGKLDVGKPLTEIINEQQTENGIQILPIDLAHTLKISELPLHHNDPFDRLLIAQSLVENIPILTKDAVFQKYDAEILW